VKKLSLEAVERVIVSAYARKMNIPEDEARKILAPLLSRKDKIREFKELLDKIGMAGEVLAGIPDDARGIAASVMFKDLVAGEEGEEISLKDIRKLALQIALIRETLKAVYGGEEKEIPDEVIKSISDLRREIAELHKKFEEKEREEREKVLLEKIAELEERVNNALKALMSSPPKGEGGGEAPVSGIEQIKALAKEINELAVALKELGYKVERPSEVKPPPSPPRPEEVKLKEKEYEISKTKADAVAKLLTDHLGPAFADLIKNPEKIGQLIDSIRKFRETPKVGERVLRELIKTSPPPPSSGPPSLVERLKTSQSPQSKPERKELPLKTKVGKEIDLLEEVGEVKRGRPKREGSSYGEGRGKNSS